MTDVIPAIFEKDWDGLVKKLALVAPHADWVQIDIADGSLSQNTTLLSFDKFAQLDKLAKLPSLEAHLMVANPERWVRPLVDAGFARIIAQVEANDPRLFLDEVVKEGVEAGLAIDGVTPLEQIEPFLETIDVVLVMLADPWSKEEAVSQENIEKIRAIRRSYPDLPIAAEGGITEKTAKMLVDAGASRLVASGLTEKRFVL